MYFHIKAHLARYNEYCGLYGWFMILLIAVPRLLAANRLLLGCSSSVQSSVSPKCNSGTDDTAKLLDRFTAGFFFMTGSF